MSVIFLNGEFVARDSARVSVFDHGYLYGDGIFEGIRAYNGRGFRLGGHLDRPSSSPPAPAGPRPPHPASAPPGRGVANRKKSPPPPQETLHAGPAGHHDD